MNAVRTRREGVARPEGTDGGGRIAAASRAQCADQMA